MTGWDIVFVIYIAIGATLMFFSLEVPGCGEYLRRERPEGVSLLLLFIVAIIFLLMWPVAFVLDDDE